MDDDGDVRNMIIDVLAMNGFVATAAIAGVAMHEGLAGGGIPIDAVMLGSLVPGRAERRLSAAYQDAKAAPNYGF